MKKLILLTLIIAACEPPKNADPIKDAEMKAFTKRYTDSVTNKINNDVMFDTIGVRGAPVKVLRAQLVKREYSSYKDISLTFKNIGNKTIEGIRFRWYGENVFGDPADMGSYGIAEGFGGGFMDKKIRPGQTMTLEWGILSRDGKKVVLAWPYEIVFEDGSKWQSSYK